MDANIVLFCRSSMSNQASQELLRLGYTNVCDVMGDMKSWLASGRALEGGAPWRGKPKHRSRCLVLLAALITIALAAGCGSAATSSEPVSLFPPLAQPGLLFLFSDP